MALLAKNNYLGKFLYLLCIFISPVLFGPARRRDTLEYHQQQSGAQAGWTGLSDQKRSSWTTSVFILAKKLSEKVLINWITVDNFISPRERVQSRGIKLQNWTVV